MLHIILYIGGALAFGTLCFIMGRRSRKYPLRDLIEAEIMYYFINKEEYRHLKDIRVCRKDKRRLRKAFPDLRVPEGRDMEAWIEAKKGKA